MKFRIDRFPNPDACEIQFDGALKPGMFDTDYIDGIADVLCNFQLCRHHIFYVKAPLYSHESVLQQVFCVLDKHYPHLENISTKKLWSEDGGLPTYSHEAQKEIGSK